MERLVNAVIQASKKIKTDTEISSGATGFFAAVRYIINVAHWKQKHSLVWY
jgi:glutamyl-tRNA reductase